MKYDAVIFDLFGTLVPSFSVEDYSSAVKEVAVCVGANTNAFTRLWMTNERSHKHMTGLYTTLAAGVHDICNMLNVPLDESSVNRAEKILFDVVRQSLTPRPSAIETLMQLKRSGLKLGLMSDCSSEMPVIWSENPLAKHFDEALFSCSVGLAKPDSRFYDLACEKLSVQPQQCFYIGDSGIELFGAEAVGMDAALICPPAEEDIIMTREVTRNWTGPRIESLAEVLELID